MVVGGRMAMVRSLSHGPSDAVTCSASSLGDPGTAVSLARRAAFGVQRGNRLGVGRLSSVRRCHALHQPVEIGEDDAALSPAGQAGERRRAGRPACRPGPRSRGLRRSSRPVAAPREQAGTQPRPASAAFFYDAWANGGADWHRIQVPAAQISRITPEFLEQERRGLGESWFRQEYCCSFEALEGLVYPDCGRSVVPGPAPAGGRKVGGLDFGFRNPFATLWGTLDRDGVLWLTGE